MAGGTWKTSSAIEVLTATSRVFLAATLLLAAAVNVFSLPLDSQILLVLELLLGAAIAIGYLIRYAAALVLLGGVISVLTPYFHLAPLSLNEGSAVAVLIASGLLVCFGENVDRIGATLIEETDKSPNEHSCRRPYDARDHDVDVTIRLETVYARIFLRRHRCIVTIHDRRAWVQKTGKEARHSRDER